MEGSRQFCTFYLDRLLFGIELEQVQAVIRYLELTDVPLAPGIVGGLMNLRGQIVTAVNLRKQLELGDRPEGWLPMNVVVRTPDGPVSMLVDEIGDVVEVEEATYEPVPEILQPRLRSLILGVHKLAGHLMHILDTTKACEVAAEPAPSS